MIPSNLFYQKLTALDDFEKAISAANHVPVPNDWVIALTDVVDSTKAIENGDYKAVNTAGGLAIMAISNVSGGMDFPFVFGGDGVSCLIPANLAEKVADVLFDTQKKVKEFFDLDLRIGLIPVQDLYELGYQLEVAKLKVADYYDQAIISGDGWNYAEDLLKDESRNKPYLITTQTDKNLEADFMGFTCRWEDIPSSKGETIATIIKIKGDKKKKELKEVTQKLYEIFGSEMEFHPLSGSDFKIARTEKQLGVEAKVFGQNSALKYFFNLQKIKFESFFTHLAMKFNLGMKFNWYKLNDLRSYQIAASDYKKFDGSLKIVLSGTSDQRKSWQSFLEEKYHKGLLNYGIHIADRAVMTCLMHVGSEREVHFIDGADGGYALAAKQLKEQMTVS